MVASSKSLLLALAGAAMAQFKPGKRDEKISGTIGDKQLDCDGIDHGSTTSLDRAMAALASQKGDWVLEANSCINLFIGCDEATKFHDSTVAFCNLNTDVEHTVSLAKEDYPGAIIEDAKAISRKCPKGEDGGISGEIFHNMKSWSVKFGAIGAGSCSGSGS